MSSCLSKAVLPLVPDLLFHVQRNTVALPTTVTFVVSPEAVFSPQTGYPWLIESDQSLLTLSIQSLVPQPSDNKYVKHYCVESRRPRFLGDSHFTDAWLTTNHRVLYLNDSEIHFSQTIFHPEKADDKLYFDQPPKNRIEVIVPGRFIEDRELWDILKGVIPDPEEYVLRQ